MADRTKELTEFMQLFCLHPDQQTYQEILNNKKLNTIQYDVIDIWQLGCIHQYGELWKLDPIVLEHNEMRFKHSAEAALAKLVIKPTPSTLDKAWYLFFSTGEYKYLKAAFETAGNTRSNIRLRETVIHEYNTVKDKYLDYIQKHQLTFDAFTLMQGDIDKKTAELDRIKEGKDADSDDDVSLQFRLPDAEEPTLAEPDEKAESGLTDEGKIVYRRASKIFDDIAKSVMNKVNFHK